MYFLNLFLIGSLWFASCLGAISKAAHPIPPRQDPFYTAPKGWEHTAPGTILRSRPAPGNLTTILGNSSAAYNFLYRTTDSQYKPSWAVTTLLVPSSKKCHAHATPKCLISYQIPYDSANLDTSPSYGMYSSAAQSLLIGIPSDNVFISQLLSQGWYVNVPDYEGPLASFGAGVMSGHAVIDSVRAVLSAKWLIGREPFQYAFWGYSGGAFASGWAAELAVQYAPELNFTGVVLGGLPTNLTGLFDAVSGASGAGLLPSALLGLTSQFPDAREALDSLLNSHGPFNRTGFFAALNLTFAEALATFSGQNILDYFVGRQSPLSNPILLKASRTNTHLGFHGVPAMPVFAYQAIEDEVAHIKYPDILYDRYCSIGANILYERNAGGGHFAEIDNGAPRALSWLASVRDGIYDLTSGCLIQNVTVDISSTLN